MPTAGNPSNSYDAARAAESIADRHARSSGSTQKPTGSGPSVSADRAAAATRRQRGEPHSDTDEVLNAARTLMPKLALALFDDAARTGDVLARINRADRGWADAVRWANRATHAI